MCEVDDGVVELMAESVESTGATRDATASQLSNKKRFYLDGPFVGVYLTFREAQSLHYYLLGLTLAGVAERLGLSDRTVECYIANIKKKLRVNTKQELLHNIQLTRFRFSA